MVHSLISNAEVPTMLTSPFEFNLFLISAVSNLMEPNGAQTPFHTCNI